MTRRILPLRVQEVTTSGFGGTGNVLLDGVPTSPAGRVSFSSGVGNGNEVVYCIDDGIGNWEITIGTLDTSGSPHELTRAATPLASSNAGSKVDFSAGVKDVFAVTQDYGLVPIAYLDASASSSLDFTAGIDDSFQDYVLMGIGIVPETDSANLRLQMSIAATFQDGSTDYEYAVTGYTSAGSAADFASQGDTAIQLTSGLGNATGEACYFELTIQAPTATVFHQVSGLASYMDSAATSVLRRQSISGVLNAASTAIDGLRLAMSSGNITSGRAILFGRRGA